MNWLRLLPLSYDRLSHITYNLSVCLASGVPLPRAFRTVTRSMASIDGEVWDRIAERMEQGEPLSDALRLVEFRLPPFFRPLVVAGEQTGRLDDVMRYLSERCRLLARPTQAFRNVWLFPLVLFLVGILLKLLVLLALGKWSRLASHTVDAVSELGSVAAIVLLIWAPPLRPIWDRMRILIPILGRAERDLAVSLFLRVFGMLYAAGGLRVEAMIRFAANTVANDYYRQDLQRAARQIEQGVALGQAFLACTTLTRDEQQTLAAGDLAGTVEASCERLSNQLDESLETRLKMVSDFLGRVMMCTVSLSLAGLVMSLF